MDAFGLDKKEPWWQKEFRSREAYEQWIDQETLPSIPLWEDPIFNLLLSGGTIRSAGHLIGKTAQSARLLAEANRLRGLAAADRFAAELTQMGFDVVGQEISAKTPIGVRVIDIVIQREGAFFGIEVKSGAAVRSAAQFVKDRFINLIGARTTGKRAVEAGVDFVEAINTVHVP